MKKIFFISAVLSLCFAHNLASADLWVTEANSNGDLKVQWFFDEDYENYDLCVKEDRVLKRWNCIEVHPANYTHNSKKPYDAEYHGGSHHFGYGVFNNNTMYKVKVQGLYRNGKRKRDLAELTVKMGTIDKLDSPYALTFDDFITAGGGHTRGEWMKGDFDGDDTDEIAFVFNDGGDISIDVYDDTYGGAFAGNGKFKRWITKSGGWPQGKWVVGDYNNDGKSDIGLIWNNNGTAVFQVYSSLGSQFAEMQWLYANAGSYIQENHWFSGDYSGDGFDDIMKVHEAVSYTHLTLPTIYSV